jgi:CP family cyanate transporter-like MFS transporter
VRSIGVIGVLLPGIVKRDFAKQAGTMTGVYTMALCLGAAMAAGSTVPLSEHFDKRWALGLGFWVIPALVAAVLVAASRPETRCAQRRLSRSRTAA